MATNAMVHKQININAKSIASEINEFVLEGATTMGIDWTSPEQRAGFTEMCEWWLEDLLTQNKIIQYKVCCNNKNNTSHDMATGVFYVDVYYKQKNCLNETRITYKIVHLGQLNLWG